jgi:hypothetical protein
MFMGKALAVAKDAILFYLARLRSPNANSIRHSIPTSCPLHEN